MVVVFLLSVLPPIVGAAIAFAALALAGFSRHAIPSRPRGLQLYLAGSAVYKVGTVAALVPLAILWALVLSGSTVVAGVLGFAAYALLGVSLQLWPDAYFRLAFPMRTKSLEGLLEQPGSLTYARLALKVLGAYADCMGLVLLVRLVFGLGP